MAHDKNYWEDMGYELIDGTVYDPANSIFKTSKNEKAVSTEYYCNRKDKCEAYKNGMCTLPTGQWSLYGGYCPFGKRERREGPTQKAKSYITFVSYRKEKYEKFYQKHLKEVNTIIGVGGEYIFLPLNHLYNYVNPIKDELELKGNYLLPVKNFTVENIVKLIIFRPRALMDNGVIQSYVKKEVPEFVLKLYHRYPEMYRAVSRIIPDIKAFVEEADYVGKKAKLFSLNPGLVKIGIHKVEWDGTNLLTNAREMAMFGLTKEKVIIVPTEETIVEICDNTTVDKDKVELV